MCLGEIKCQYVFSAESVVQRGGRRDRRGEKRPVPAADSSSISSSEF
jgi:hypothetical protein